MHLYLHYGSFKHALGEATWGVRRGVIRNKLQQRIGTRQVWDVTGTVVASTQAKLFQRVNAIKQAYSRDGLDFKMLLANGQETPCKIISANCIGGVRVTEAPSFPPHPVGWTTSVPFTLQITAENFIGVDSAADPQSPGGTDGSANNQGGAGTPEFEEWHESMTFTGDGGPDTVDLVPRTGPIITQQVSDVTLITAQQTGSAIGFFDWPDPPGPLLPAFEIRKLRTITKTTPPLNPGGNTRFETRWSYSFRGGAITPVPPGLLTI